MCQENILSLSISGHLRYFLLYRYLLGVVLYLGTGTYTHVVVTHVFEVDTRVPVLPICILHSRTVRYVLLAINQL
jgi:hypothetical protein